jgi:cbb3-type cytochrome oxidase cytochrome c subunit
MKMRDYPTLHFDITQIYVKEQCFYCSQEFHSHGRVSNNEYNSYPKMRVKWPLVCI